MYIKQILNFYLARIKEIKILCLLDISYCHIDWSDRYEMFLCTVLNLHLYPRHVIVICIQCFMAHSDASGTRYISTLHTFGNLTWNMFDKT